MTSLRSRRHGALKAWLLFAVATSLTGCAAHEPIRTNDAEATVRSYLNAAGGGAEDRGWSLLLPVTQQTTFAGDEMGYIAAADATDWQGFHWSIGRVVPDEPYTYQVSLVAENEAVPELVALVTDFEDSPYPPGPTFTVRFHDHLGGEGIWQMNGINAFASPRRAVRRESEPGFEPERLPAVDLAARRALEGAAH